MIKRIIILVAIFSIVVSFAFSSEAERQGSHSLLFQISEKSFLPHSFMGGIGFQFYINEKVAMRIPIGFGTYREIWTKPENAEKDKIQSASNLQFTPGLRYDFGKGNKVIVYTGTQLLFAFTDSTMTGRDYKSNEKNTFLYTWGIGLMLGAEWFPYRSLGLSLEYSPFLTFSAGETTYKSGGFEQTDILPEQMNFNTNFASVLFVVSFYFD